MSFQHGFRRRVHLAVALALLIAGPTCSYPTDDSDRVEVVISPPTNVVLRGDQVQLFARAVRVTGADTVAVPNTTFEWASSDPTVATVADLGSGAADVTGVNTGVADITVKAVAFERSTAGSRQMRVATALEVDSVRPMLVRYGDTVTVFGIGVDSLLFAVRLGPGGNLFPVPFSARRDSAGVARRAFWVPFPAQTDRLFYIGPGVFGSVAETTAVVRRDIYEPSDTFPINIGLDGPRPFPQVPSLIYVNPALAFEPLGVADTIGTDWYRFLSATPRDLTIVLTSPTVAGTFATFLTDSLELDTGSGTYLIGPDSWSIGPQSHACHGLGFAPRQRIPDSTIVALAGLPRINIHILSQYTRAGAYGLALIEGYVVTDSLKAPRDAHEEDDYCSAADPPAKRVTLPFRDTLTIDNPVDVDWIRFTWPGGPLRLRTMAVVAPGDTIGRDIDLYLIRVPNPGDFGLQIASRTTPGATEDLNIVTPVAAGDYYAVVVDFAGVPTAYDLCIAACATFPAVATSSVRAWRRPAGPRLDGPLPASRRSPSARP